MPESVQFRREWSPQKRLQDASFASATLDKEKRTVEVVWSTGADVKRYDFWEDRYYLERLSLDPAHVRIERLNNGAPFLNCHQMSEVGDVIGVVQRAWIENGVGKAIVQFSSREDVAPIIADVETGILRGVSIGYRINKVEIDESNPNLPVYRATDWEPFEISLVPIGADQGASVRSAETSTTNPCEFTRNHTKEIVMPPEDVQTQPQNNPVPVDQAAVRAAALQEERARVAAIEGEASKLGLRRADIESMLTMDVSIDAARAQMIDLVAARAKAAGGPTPVAQVSATPSGDDPAVRVAAMAEAQAARFSTRIKPSDMARQYTGFGVLDLAKEIMRARGERNIPYAPAAIIDAVTRNFHTSSDFSGLLSATANKILMGEYEAAAPTYRALTAKRNFRDFKPNSFNRLGDFPTLLAVNEKGEIQSGTISSGKETVTLATYGRIIGLSRQALINDDLGAFADISTKIGRRASDFENSTFFALLALNTNAGPALADGFNLFDATNHKNAVASGTVIDVAGVAAGRALMQKQTGLDGLKLNLSPSIILTGADRALQAEQLVGTIMPNQASAINPFSGRLQPISDANVSGNQWYLFAAPTSAEALIWGYLEGAEGPRLETRNGFTTEGVEFKVALDFGVGAVDHRPVFRNPGA
ncbi:MAG: prohead protease/major capsid protein fusion protein [Alphaproteobacteria bacterium]